MNAADPVTLRAVAYYRCSSDAQELSVDQQRPEVEHLADQGHNGRPYRVVRPPYVDEGKSGSRDPDKRTAFKRLLADAAKGEFDVVLVYDLSRFTRADSIASAADKDALRRAGVYLHSVREGVVDWRNSTDRIRDAISAETNNAAALTLSALTVRGRAYVARQGWWPCGAVPYGFDRSYTDGTRTVDVTRGDHSFKKGRNWHLKLIANPVESAIVKEIFRRVWSEGITWRALAADLTKRGIPSPDPMRGTGRGWTKDTIKTVLFQKAYIGVASIGGPRRRKEAFNRVESLEIPGACPALIDPNLFGSVQESIARRRADGRKPQYHRSAPLSGFLVCGHCGWRLEKKLRRGRVYFTCGSANKRPGLGCRQWRVFEDTIQPQALNWLAESLDFELLKALQAKPGEKTSGAETVKAAEVDRLRGRVERATESALEAPTAARPKAWEVVKRWQRDLEQAETALQAIRNARNDDQLKELGQWWEKNRAAVLSFPATVQQGTRCIGGELHDVYRVRPPVKADAALLRGLLSKLGFEVRLFWRHDPAARLKDRSAFEWVLSEQRISVKVPLTSGHSSGDRSSTDPRSVFGFTRTRKVA